MNLLVPNPNLVEVWIVIGYRLDEENMNQFGRPIFDQHIFGIFTTEKEAELAVGDAYDLGWDDVINEEFYLDRTLSGTIDFRPAERRRHERIL